MMTQRRRLMMNIKPFESRYYIYNNGQTPGHDVQRRPAWDLGSAILVSDNTIYMGENSLHIRTNDTSSTAAVGVSIVDNIGISGAVLNKYKTLTMTAALVLNGAKLGNNQLCLYTVFGSVYTENCIYCALSTDVPASGDFTAYTWDLSGESFNNDAVYYFGYRFQSGKTLKPGYQSVYISKIFLE